MGSGFDIFNNLNSYLNKGDESFQYDSASSTPNSTKSAVHSKENSPIPIDIETTKANEEEIVEINEEQSLSQRARRARKRQATQVSNNSSSCESIDLTDTSSSSSPNKSRRKLADEVGSDVFLAIDLCDVSPASNTRGSGQKKTASAKKPKKVSYKKALEAARKPLPELPKPKEKVPFLTPAAVTPPQRERQERVYDLTGDVELTSKHSSEPLFQKSKKSVIDTSKKILTSTSYNISQEFFDIDFSLINLNIKIKGKIETFKHKNDKRFYEVFKAISEKVQKPVSDIFLFDGNEKRVLPEETPLGIGHKISTIYTCRFMDASKTRTAKENRIELKFQSDKWKKPIVMKVSRVDAFSKFIKSLSEQVNFKPEQFSLEFDGDHIDLSETPMDLEFEGGEILDCRIKA